MKILAVILSIGMVTSSVFANEETTCPIYTNDTSVQAVLYQNGYISKYFFSDPSYNGGRPGLEKDATVLTALGAPNGALFVHGKVESWENRSASETALNVVTFPLRLPIQGNSYRFSPTVRIQAVTTPMVFLDGRLINITNPIMSKRSRVKQAGDTDKAFQSTAKALMTVVNQFCQNRL